MPNIYLVHDSDDAVWRCFFQSDDGPMGLEWCAKAWSLFLQGAWLWQKAEETFVSLESVSPHNRVMVCRKELQRWALTLIGPSEDLLETLAQIENYRRHRRRSNLYRRYHREIPMPAPPHLWSVLAADDPRTAADEISAQVEICQIWRFSDRGVWFEAIGLSVENVVHAVGMQIGIPITLLESMDHVPTW